MQDITGWQEELALPSTTDEGKARLTENVWVRKNWIQDDNSHIAESDSDLSLLRAALGKLGNYAQPC